MTRRSSSRDVARKTKSSRRTTRRDSKSPLWEQVLTDLRRRMSRGEFTSGFPTDRELMKRYKVSRHTAREAVRHLQAEGVLTRYKGRGSFVQPLSLEQRVGPLYSLFRSIEDQGHVQRSDVLDLRSVRDREVAEQMGLPVTTKFFFLRRLRRADGTPFAVDEIWLPERIAAPLYSVNFEYTAVYTELERLTDARPVRGWERIRPALPSTEEQKLLGIGPRQPVFVVSRYTETHRGPLEWRTTVVRGDAYTFTTTWSNSKATSEFGVRTTKTTTPRRGRPRSRSAR
ncbi:MAG: GntR family transcriptional regulator [Ilumatobacteraceae bacterium]